MGSMGYSGSKSESEQTYMPGQLDLIRGGSELWANLMRNYQPTGSVEDVKYPGMSPYTTQSLNQATELAQQGGYTAEEQAALESLTSYLSEPTGQTAEDLMKAAQEYYEAEEALATEDLSAAERVAAYDYAAKGKYGSGGHLTTLSDLYSDYGQQLSQLAEETTQQALETARYGSLEEQMAQQEMADYMSDVYGAAGQAERLTGLSELGAYPREMGIAELDRMYDLYQNQMNELLNMLGIGAGIGTMSGTQTSESTGSGANAQYTGFDWDWKYKNEPENYDYGYGYSDWDYGYGAGTEGGYYGDSWYE